MPNLPPVVQQLLASGFFASLVMIVLSLLKPYVELVPAFRPGAKLHDSFLDLLNTLLNIGLLAVFWPYLNGGYSPYAWLLIVVYGLLQAHGGNQAYSIVTTRGGSVGDSKSTPVVGVAGPTNVAHDPASDPFAAEPAVSFDPAPAETTEAAPAADATVAPVPAAAS